VFDGAFLGRDAWGRRPSWTSSTDCRLPRNLLAAARAVDLGPVGGGAGPRLWAQAGRGERVSSGEVVASFEHERDYVIRRHVVGRIGTLAAT
jgi:hypothetical protein